MRRRRRRRTWSPEISAAERLWALGELGEEHPGHADVAFFTQPERLRAVWSAVHGESFGAWLLRDSERWVTGHVLVGLARVASLTPDDVQLLRAGLDPWAHELED